MKVYNSLFLWPAVCCFHLVGERHTSECPLYPDGLMCHCFCKARKFNSSDYSFSYCMQFHALPLTGPPNTSDWIIPITVVLVIVAVVSIMALFLSCFGYYRRRR